jgi:hypothetical protein
MAIQNRRGDYAKFDPQKLLPGEWGIVLTGDSNAADGMACYMCFSPGVVKRMATYQDMVENMGKLSADVVKQVMEDFASAMTAATAAANTAASEASSAAGTASQAATNAANQAAAASTAASGANVAIQRINDKLEEMETAGPVLQSEKGSANGVAALDSSGKVPASQIPDTIAAAKLASAKTIDGMNFDGSANINHFCICSTAAATVAKTASLSGFKLGTGARVTVKFTYGCTAANPTLNINSTGAKAIYYKGAAVPAGYVLPNSYVELIYDGTQYNIVSDLTDTQLLNLKNTLSGVSGLKILHGRATITTSTEVTTTTVTFPEKFAEKPTIVVTLDAGSYWTDRIKVIANVNDGSKFYINHISTSAGGVFPVMWIAIGK